MQSQQTTEKKLKKKVLKKSVNFFHNVRCSGQKNLVKLRERKEEKKVSLTFFDKKWLLFACFPLIESCCRHAHATPTESFRHAHPLSPPLRYLNSEKSKSLPRSLTAILPAKVFKFPFSPALSSPELKPPKSILPHPPLTPIPPPLFLAFARL